jgi:dihydrofolate reductase
MKLILACSFNGALCTGPKDNMRWTGGEDKRLFRLLTTTSGGVCLVGSATLGVMPRDLPARKLVPLSRNPEEGLLLEDAAEAYPDAWLLGGPSIARLAMEHDLVSEAILCRVLNVMIHPHEHPEARFLSEFDRWWPAAAEIKHNFNLTRVEVYRWPVR